MPCFVIYVPQDDFRVSKRNLPHCSSLLPGTQAAAVISNPSGGLTFVGDTQDFHHDENTVKGVYAEIIVTRI